MTDAIDSLRRAGPNELRLFANPSFWPQWPYLPVLRFLEDDEPEFGMLYDAQDHANKSGHQTTVFCATLADIVLRASRFLTSRHVYDSVEELADAGWIIDWNLVLPAAGPMVGQRLIPFST